MTASKPASSFSQAHFFAPPAMPTTRSPSFFASWPAVAPTGPAAEVTSRVSPSFAWPTRFRPNQAVRPGTPRMPIQQPRGTRRSVIFWMKPRPSDTKCSRQPPPAAIRSPTAKLGCLLSMTSATQKPSMPSPIFIAPA